MLTWLALFLTDGRAESGFAIDGWGTWIGVTLIVWAAGIAYGEVDKKRSAAAPPEPAADCYSAAAASLISAMTSPDVTVAPTSTLRPVTTPSLWALIGCSIFMASTTTIWSPAETV